MSDLKFGYDEIVINPGRGITPGGYRRRLEEGIGNSGIHDNLYARALSLKMDETELLLITLDMCMMSVEISDNLREAVSKKLNIPKECIMLSVIHTHSGTSTHNMDALKGKYDESSFLKFEKDMKEYLDELKESLFTISTVARNHLHKCSLSTATLKMNLGYNRRYPLKDKQGNPSVKMRFSLWESKGEHINHSIDDEVPVLMIEKINRDTEDEYLEPYGPQRLVIFSVPIHPAVLGESSRIISADYPGVARRCIEESIGSGTKAMFMLGACGDINPVIAGQRNVKSVNIIGSAIGYGVTAVLAGREKIGVESIEFLEEDYLDKNNRIIIQVFKIGGVAIVAVSAECFSELGIRIRKASGFAQTLIATNTNGYEGYLPSRSAFPEGGYEIRIAHRKGYPDDILEKIIEKALAMLNE